MKILFLTKRMFLVEERFYCGMETGIMNEDELRDFIKFWFFDDYMPMPYGMTTDELVQHVNLEYGHDMEITEL